MIHSGDWTAADLVKYLVAVRETLTTLEIDRLKQTATFMREESAENSAVDTKDSAVPKRYMATELYEPVDTLRALGLPILSWGEQAKWRPNSEEGKQATLSIRITSDALI
jgi:hypothetical protein